MALPSRCFRSLLCTVLLGAASVACDVHEAGAQVQSDAQARCAVSLAKGGAKLAKTRFKEWQGCLKSAAGADLGDCPSAEACVAGDIRGKIANSVSKIRSVEESSCAEEPDFGRPSASMVSKSVLVETQGLMDDVFGPDLDLAAASKTSDPAAASCQGRMAKAVSKHFLAMVAAWDACKTAGLEAGAITGPATLGDCLSAIDDDTKGKIAAAWRGVEGVLGACSEVDATVAFPGSCALAPELGACLEARSRCRACRRGAVGDDTDEDCDLFDDGDADNDSCTGYAGRCHGRAALCERPFDEVAYPTTHNAFTNEEENWNNPNQRYGLTRQMTDGVRGLMLDTYFYLGEVVMCHGLCNLGEAQGYTPREPLVDGLERIADYLEVDPDAVITIIFESYISEAQVLAAFTDAGLLDLVHSQDVGDPWPTLGDLVESGRRLVVFTDDSSATLPWHLYVWDHAWETPFSFQSTSEFTCSINRGTPGAPLYILNHFLTQTFGSEQLARQANRDPLFRDRALQCETEGGQIPNFVTVDFHDIGSLFPTTNLLNDLPVCATP